MVGKIFIRGQLYEVFDDVDRNKDQLLARPELMEAITEQNRI